MLYQDNFMNSNLARSLLLFAILAFIVGISLKLVSFYHTQPVSNTVQEKIRPLPADVEIVLKGYTYSETGDDLTIQISGRQMVRRGRKMLGLRSNVVKTNFLKQIKGTLTTPKNIVAFSASDAEWDANPEHPLILTGAVSVTMNSKGFEKIKNARIFFNQGLIEITSDSTVVHKFR